MRVHTTVSYDKIGTPIYHTAESPIPGVLGQYAGVVLQLNV